MGGANFPQVLTLSEEAVLELALSEFETMSKIRLNPEFSKIICHPQALPLFDVGHRAVCQKIAIQIQKISPNFLLGGSAFRGVGIEKCIGAGFDLAHEAFSRLSLVKNA